MSTDRDLRIERLELIVLGLAETDMWLRPKTRELLEAIRAEHREAQFDAEFVPTCGTEGS